MSFFAFYYFLCIVNLYWQNIYFIDQLLINSLSHWSRIFLISSLADDFSFLRMDTQITFLDVPHDFPRAFLDGTNTYGTF